MEKASFLRLVQRAVAVALANKPVLPQYFQDLEPEEQRRFSTPPTSPCHEVVVINADGARVVESRTAPEAVGFRIS
jgi:hypothetical protein